MTITAEDLVNREVLACVSHLVSTLAQGYSLAQFSEGDLGNLSEQACALASPVDDWEEAARQAGWDYSDTHGTFYRPVRKHGVGYDNIAKDDWRELCDREDIEPYQWEVYEHWTVSDWLADKLEAHGEKVDKDFAGLCVWARTTTGQAISMDSVIQAIYAELTATT